MRTLFVSALLLPGLLSAQAPPSRHVEDDWVLDRWGSDQGLPQNTVNGIAQTPDGYLWIATNGGLVRFDGVRFTAFTTLDHSGLGSDRVLHLKLATDGSLWLGTDRALVHFRNGRFREWGRAEGRPEGPTTSMSLDAAGAVWISTQTGVARFADGRFERFTDRGAPAGYASDVRVDGAGNVWFNHGDRRLLVLRPGKADFEPVVLETNGVRATYPQLIAPNGDVYFNSSKGIARWDGRTLTAIGITAPVLAGDAEGGLWMASPWGGLSHRDRSGRLTTMRATEANGFADARTIFIDREGTVWVGSNARGLVRVRRRLFRVYLREDGLAVEQVAAVMRDSHGRLLVGSSCGATSVLTDTVFKAISPPVCAFALAESPDGAIWWATWGKGLNRIGPNGRETRITAGLPSTNAMALWADRDTTIWVGTDGGLVRYARGAVHAYTIRDGLPSNQIHYITRDRGGALWIGTEGGLARLEGERFRAWTTRDGLPHNYVRAIHQGRDGVYWIGTYGGGLARFDGAAFVAIGTREGLYDNVVSTILEDSAGSLWMGGNRGIFRAHRSSLEDFAAGRTTQVTSVGYGPSDGLVTPETNGGFQPAAWQDADGRLWFATVRGLATVHPRDAVPVTAAPRVAIEGIRVDGRDLSIGAALRLPVGARSVEIQYTGLTSIAPEHLVFRYRLEGLDDDWVHVQTRRVAYFNSLPTGNYRFTVAARSRAGVWSEASQPLVLVVPAAWYASLWFRSVLTLAIAGALFVGLRRRVATLREQQRIQREFARHLIAGQEGERRRLAGELHDSLGQDLLVMKTRARMALNGGDLSDATRVHMQEIADVAHQALVNAREISHGLRPYQLDRLGLVAALRDLAERVGTAGSLAIAIEAGPDDLFDGDAATHVYRIVQEALNNVLKYSQASGVRICLAREGNGARLRIIDDGRGTDPDASGFGIVGMRQRAQILGGTLQIVSAPGAGTTLDIFIPDVPAWATR